MAIVVEEAKTAREKSGMARKEDYGSSVVPNWNEMAESQKEIHSPSTIPSSYSFQLPLISRNNFASRTEIFVPSFAAMRCPTALFSPSAIVFICYGARISMEIYPCSRVLMYFGISTGTSCWELSRDGWTRDDGFSEIKWRIAASLFNFVILPPTLTHKTSNE